MEIITERESIRREVKLFQRKDLSLIKDVRERFAELDPDTATKEQIDTALGYTHWNNSFCDECEKHTTAVVEIGGMSGNETNTAWICADCISKAAVMLDEALRALSANLAARGNRNNV